MELSDYLASVDEAYVSLRGGALESRLLELLAAGRDQFGENSPACAALLSELGSYYRGQARFTDSADCYTRALAAFPPDSPDRATVLNNLAGTHRLMCEYEQAESEFRTALDIYRRTLGEDHILYASALNNLSLLYMDRGETDRAVRCLEDASGVLSGLPDRREEYASSLCNLAGLEILLSRPESAAARLREAVRLMEDELGTDTPHYHAALNSLGIAFLHTGDARSAAEAFGKALEAARGLYGDDHPDVRKLQTHLDAARKEAEKT